MSARLPVVVSTRLEEPAGRELKRLAARAGHSVADELRGAVRHWLLRSRLAERSTPPPAAHDPG